MRQRAGVLLPNLRSVASQAAKVLERFTSAAERLSSKSSSTLTGVLGGIGGLTAAYFISLFFPAVSLPVLGPLLTAGGIAGGIAVFRGPRRFALDRTIETNRSAYDEQLKKIKGLPKNTPDHIRNEYWEHLRDLESQSHEQVARILEGKKGSKQLPP